MDANFQNFLHDLPGSPRLDVHLLQLAELFLGLDLPAKYDDVLGKPGHRSPLRTAYFCGLGTSPCKDSEIGDRVLRFPDVQKKLSKMDFGHLNTSHCPSACSDR